MFLSSRSQVDPFHAMDVLSAANALEAQGRRIYHLETGQPGTPAPRMALAAARAALQDDRLGYTEALGRPALKEAIAARYRTQYDLNIDPRRIVVTTGSSAGFILSFLAGFEAGMRLCMAAPGYPAYRNTAHALNLKPLLVPTPIEAGFQLKPEMIEAQIAATGEVPDGLLIASPGNPTGTVLAPDSLQGLAGLARSGGWRLISDEIYHGLTYGAPAQTILRYAPDAIVINSFSKYYSMTGWRIGWMVVPPDFVRPIERLAQNLFISPPTISQIAARAALDADDELQGHVEAYRRNRARLLKAFATAGLTRIAPADGAFYLYVDVSALGEASDALARRLLDETGVATTPGLDFDPDQGLRWLRLSYANAEAEISAAADILAHWFKRG